MRDFRSGDSVRKSGPHTQIQPKVGASSLPHAPGSSSLKPGASTLTGRLPASVEAHALPHHGGGQHVNGHRGGQGHYTAAPSLVDVRTGKAVIKSGMEGPSVAFVQEKVHAVADAQFGSLTEAAVKRFQVAHHLPADGEVGVHTIAAMDGHGKQTQNDEHGGTSSHEQDPDGGQQGSDHGGKGDGDHAEGVGDPSLRVIPPDDFGTPSAKAFREEVISQAQSHLGDPYDYGTEGPNRFDCSGFVWFVLAKDTELLEKPRTTAAGLSDPSYTTPIDTPKKGDLVFYSSSGHIEHVTIALGSNDKTIGASGGDSNTHGDNPKARVKFTNWKEDTRTKSFGSIKRLIHRRRHNNQ